MATPTQAKVTSTDALEGLREAMILFVMKARRALDDTSHAARLTRQWVQFDQRTHWMGELKRRHKKLERAQQELMSAKLASSANTAMANRERAVTKAQRDIQEAEVKLRKIKAWNQNFDAAADPAIKRVDRLQHTLQEYQKAIAYLVAIQKALAAYAERNRSAADASISIAAMSAELGIDINAEAQRAPVTATEAEPALETTAQPEGEAKPSISLEALSKELGIDMDADVGRAPTGSNESDVALERSAAPETGAAPSISLADLSKELGIDMGGENPAAPQAPIQPKPGQAQPAPEANPPTTPAPSIESAANL